MAYECQKFVNGQVLTAECLNRMDEALAGVCSQNDGCADELKVLASDLETTQKEVSDISSRLDGVEFQEEAVPNTAPKRGSNAEIRVGDPVIKEDAVNLGTMGRLTANALIGEKSGNSITFDDISPVPSTVKVSVESKNLVPLVYYHNRNGENPVTIRGIVFTTNEDGSITMNGTHDGTGNVSFFLVSSSTKPFVLKKGTYISGTGLSYASLSYMRTDGKYETFGKTLTEETQCRYLYISMMQDKITGKTFNGETIYPMLMRGTVIEDYTAPIAEGTAVQIIPSFTDQPIETAVGETIEFSSVQQGDGVNAFNEGVVLHAEYNRDINIAFAELQQAIISLGGNV